MNDEIRTELKRFAELCSERRPDWEVSVDPSSDNLRASMVWLHGDDLAYEPHCAAWNFCLMSLFKDIGFRVIPHQGIVTVYSNRPPGVGMSLRVGKDVSLYHAALYVLLKSANGILEQEAQCSAGPTT